MYSDVDDLSERIQALTRMETALDQELLALEDELVLWHRKSIILQAIGSEPWQLEQAAVEIHRAERMIRVFSPFLRNAFQEKQMLARLVQERLLARQQLRPLVVPQGGQPARPESRSHNVSASTRPQHLRHCCACCGQSEGTSRLPGFRVREGRELCETGAQRHCQCQERRRNLARSGRLSRKTERLKRLERNNGQLQQQQQQKEPCQKRCPKSQHHNPAFSKAFREIQQNMMLPRRKSRHHSALASEKRKQRHAVRSVWSKQNMSRKIKDTGIGQTVNAMMVPPFWNANLLSTQEISHVPVSSGDFELDNDAFAVWHEGAGSLRNSVYFCDTLGSQDLLIGDSPGRME